ncbi:uncharacterized protein LOC128388043 isoform X1 [Panonychus citri]|uniref:uncharacterized protein LOC128388043 isoform X1 n=1 Tax=Panonychus citri TaxID=50023 RepID=UPI002307DCD1|nr:uncharacterized protein LOC128388043 isoform X1 [Panonychus citri]XP_053203365.1 uncharacterized protein LOC128388043 isoform X1 [Panonychus citri]XP_053203366.1 uncharacterized protein LOC128388043 isoform X1 [Panonychus citri]
MDNHDLLAQHFLTDQSENRLGVEFFNSNSCFELAKRLLGKVICRRSRLNGSILAGMIVETECYPGGDDQASHSYKGKKTPRNEPMFMDPGSAYVYFTYGMYHCFNISSCGEGAAVLIRALKPVSGLKEQSTNRLSFRKKSKPTCSSSSSHSGSIPSSLRDTQIANGPGKLCIALDIDKETINKENLILSNIIWLVGYKDYPDEEITFSKRIGINTDAESRNQLWRFYIRDSHYVSVRDEKKREPKSNKRPEKMVKSNNLGKKTKVAND